MTAKMDVDGYVNILEQHEREHGVALADAGACGA